MTGPNPYQPPAIPSEGQWAESQGIVSPAIIDSLGRMRPWVVMVAILDSIWIGLCALGVLVILMAGLGELEKAIGYLVAVGVTLFPVLAMFRLRGAIDRLMDGGGQQELEQTIDAQRGYWQIIGIMTLVCIAFGIFSIFAAFQAEYGLFW